jgi:hypothetical protein
LTLFWFIRGDFLERTRSYSFLVTLIAILVAASLGLPPSTAGYATVDLDGWRGLYDSAWVGTSVSLLTSLFLSLIGFYLVKNSLERDRQTGVGQVLAATPLSRFGYLLGKALSNGAVLGVLVVAVMIMAGVMQWMRGESRVINLVDLMAPFLLVTMPLMLMVGGLAVLFEAVPFLRGSFGNVAWFFFGVLMLVGPGADHAAFEGYTTRIWTDPMGAVFLIGEMSRGAREAVPNMSGDNVSVGINIDAGRTLQTFDWGGIRWTPAILAARFLWLLSVLVVMAAAVPFFDRFSRDRARTGRRPWRGGKRAAESTDDSSPTVALAHASFAATSLTPLVARVGAPNLARLVRAELVLLVSGQPRIWYLVAAGLSVACLASPPQARAILGPIAWIWPLAIWSALGCRERLHGTEALLDSSPHPVVRRLLAQWLAGATVTLLATVGLGVAVMNDPSRLAAWLIAAAFVPALALSAGVVSGGRRLFEVLYILLWYVGPMNRGADLDYTGLAFGAIVAGTPVRCAIAALFLLTAAAAFRARRIHSH